ncbi:hypothetical protein D3C75_926680 [compost metagenome]
MFGHPFLILRVDLGRRIGRFQLPMVTAPAERIFILPLQDGLPFPRFWPPICRFVSPFVEAPVGDGETPSTGGQNLQIVNPNVAKAVLPVLFRRQHEGDMDRCRALRRFKINNLIRGAP